MRKHNIHTLGDPLKTALNFFQFNKYNEIFKMLQFELCLNILIRIYEFNICEIQKQYQQREAFYLTFIVPFIPQGTCVLCENQSRRNTEHILKLEIGRVNLQRM